MGPTRGAMAATVGTTVSGHGNRRQESREEACQNPPLILIVDDETHIVNVLSVTLQSAGLRVTCAYDGREAVRCALGETPDLIITDDQMPQMDGPALCEALKQFKKTYHTPIIMLTAMGEGTGKSGNSMTGNVKAYIRKPFSPARGA